MGLLKVKIMRLLRFDGVVGYKNNSHIAKGDNDEPILMNDCYDYEYREETEIYIGSHEELKEIWQSLTKNKTQYPEPNFIEDIDYCIVVSEADQSGEHYHTAIPKIYKVSEVNWDHYEDITSWIQITENENKLFMKWLKLHSLWKEHKKKVK